MDEGKYILFDIDKLSDIEKDIILAIGDDIKNKLFTTIRGCKLKYLKKTKELLPYDDNKLFESLSLLCLKDLIDIKTDWEELHKYIERARNEGGEEYSAFITRLYFRLEDHQDKLNMEGLNLIHGYYNENQIEEIIEKLSNIEAVELKTGAMALIHNIQNFRDKKEQLLYNLHEAELYLLLQNFTSKPEKILSFIINNFFDKEKILCMTYVYLTSHKNAGINGEVVYNRLYSEQLDNKLKSFKEIEQKVKSIERKIDLNLLKNIEIITIFVAVITIIIGNVSFLPQISSKTALGSVSLILIINGSLISGVTIMMILMAKITDSSIKNKCLCIILSIVIALSMGGGITLSFFDNANIKIETESTVNDIKDGLTIENNINATNEGAQPAPITISPEVSIEVQPTPTPTPTFLPTQTE